MNNLKALSIILILFIETSRSFGNPQGMTVQSGSASAVANGTVLTVTAANDTHLNWQSFNIATGESTIFQQPSSSSIVWNNIGGQAASQIYGNLQANGVVVLMNSSGFYFGPNSFVKAAGLVVSTAPGAPLESSGGSGWQFTGPPPSAKIVNYGQITSDRGGFVFLLGSEIDNFASVTAPDGNIGLCAGKTILISERPDGRGLSAQVTLPQGVINNNGALNIDSGTLLASAQVVNQNGVVQANSVNIANGVVELYASQTLNLGSGSSLQLTGQASANSQLKLEAGENVTVANNATITAGEGWSVTVEAGRDFSRADGVVAGTGSITFNGSSGIQTGSGDIGLLAGNNITINNGAVRTIGGGNISATAVSGSVKAGVNPNGFDFRPTGYSVDPDLGGISTANGGNVSITAGKDIVSYLPVAGGVQTDAGTGCFGTAPGNVVLTAGHDILGHYVLANGVGIVNAANNAGSLVKPMALSLIDGGWNVTAGNNIVLQEIRNPNGIFNNLGSGSSRLRHYFDYSADSYATLSAGNGIQLLGSALPRYDDSFESTIPSIYPPKLQLSAGAGGISVGGDVILFPSPKGWLGITTTDGGSLTSSKTGSDFTQIVLSDSSKVQYLQSGDFGIGDHAVTPVHINDTRAVQLNVSGNMEKIYLVSSEKAEVNVGGDMIDCRFDGQNLHASDATVINVAGNIVNRSEFTSVTVDAPPDFTDLNSALLSVGSTITGPGLASLFFYDRATQKLTFQGRMTTEQFQFLQNLQVQAYDAHGQPIFDSKGNPVTKLAQFIDPAKLQALYSASQDIPSDPDSGYRIGGGGTFKATANNLDLGATAGIVALGPAENPGLANYFQRGANLDINIAGNLDLFSTTISCLSGGNISVVAGGHVNLGSDYFTGNDQNARGIFTTCNSDVSVIAGEDIAINGSRIATYDGGDIVVESLHGNVAVGTGGQGSASVREIYVDPITRKISSYTVTIPGSGILATTFPKSLDRSFPTSRNPAGNILVKTPEGNITAKSAGITQVPLNGASSKAGKVTLTAGTKDSEGKPVHIGNIDVSGSGVIGANVELDATGNIKGTIVARNNLDLSALQSVAVSAFATGDLSVDAGNAVSGTLIGLNSISVNAGTIDAALLSQNITASGTIATPQIGFAPVTVANSTSQSFDSSAQDFALSSRDAEDYDTKKQHLPQNLKPTQSAGRVTVVPTSSQ